jgi:hypothetical protein
MEKFIIHLHLYLSDKENEYIAYQNLKKLKQHGFKILITSPKPLPEYLYEFIDFFCYDKENQLLTREYENIEPTILWTRSGDTELRFVTVKQQRHGLAVLRAMIKGCKLASAYGFEYIVRFEYDDCFGPQSMKLIEETARKIVENHNDFYVYKNEYIGSRNDVSVHLMYYNCDRFVEIFESVKDEETYNQYLDRLGHSRQALILEQFILSALENNTVNANIVYDKGENLTNLYSDTAFNRHQSDPGLKDGVLSDVLQLRIDGNLVHNQVYLAAQNFSSDKVQTIYYDVFDENDNIIHTYFLELEKTYWQYIPISLDNVKMIKIKHNHSEHHKIIYVDPDTKQISCFEDNIQQPFLSEASVTQ